MSAKTVILTGNHPAELEVWFYTLYESVTKCALDKFCEILGHAMCHRTLGALVVAGFGVVWVCSTDLLILRN